MKPSLLRLINLSLIFVMMMSFMGSPEIVRGHVPEEVMGTPENVSEQREIEENQPLTGDAWNVGVVGHIGGHVRVITIKENYAYISEGPQLSILNISNPSEPVSVGKAIPVPEMITGIDVSSGYACVTAGAAGLWVINVSDPTNPVIVSSMDTPGYASDVKVYGSYAYVADGYSGMRIVDISDPDAPIEVGVYNAVVGRLSILSSGQYIAITSSSFVEVLDISNPYAPFNVAYLVDGWSPEAITISDNYAYVVSSGLGPVTISVSDISDPMSPQHLGTFAFADLMSNGGIAVSQGYAYISDGYGGMRVVDVSDPANIYEVAVLGQSIGYYTGSAIAITGESCYVSDGFGGLTVMSISNPAAPVEIGSYNTSTYPIGLDVNGEYVYVAGSFTGLSVVDASNPSRPVEIGKLERDDTFPMSVDVSGDYAYVADYGLRVVDVSSPTNPVEASRVELSEAIHAEDVTVGGDYAYFVGGNTVIGVADVSNTLAPTEVYYEYNVAGGSGVAVAGNTLCVTTHWYYEDTLSCAELWEPEKPEMRSGLFMTNPEDVFISGSFAYVADGESGLKVVDISDLSAITEASYCDTPGQALSVFISGSYAYIADYFQGLRVIDISDPYNPIEIGFYDTAGTAVDVVVSGGYIYVADSEGGLYILQLMGEGIVYSISGHVDDIYGHPISGVLISSDFGGSTQTDVNGNYMLTGLNPGIYTITPTKYNYEFTAPMELVSVPPDTEGVDFLGEQLDKLPVILVPGFGATANFNCFLLGETCDDPDAWGWAADIAAGLYQPLIDAFAAAGTGYTAENHFFTVFFYDLRKPLLDNALELDQLIQQTKELTGATSVDLIGHSMGGLISRAYVQSALYDIDVAHLITLGSPHQGVVPLYATWEGGGVYHFCTHDEWQPFIDTISMLYFKFLENNEHLDTVIFIQSNIPSIKDLLYTEDYLYENSDGSLIPEIGMNERNLVLAYLNQNLNSLYQRTEVSTFAGYGYDTPQRFYVYPYSSEDYPKWVDGEPNWDREPEFLSSRGDDTVLVSSASLPRSFRYFSNTTHGGLPGSPLVISQILSILGIADPTITELTQVQVSTSETPMMILALYGSANALVTDPNGFVISQDVTTIPGAEYISNPDDPFKVIRIPNPNAGEFRIEIEGSDDGNYAFGRLDTFSPPTTLISDLLDLWDISRSQIEPAVEVTYSLTYTPESTEPPILIAVTPVIQTPVMSGSTVVEGRALPGQDVDIYDADSHMLLGSEIVGADGHYQVTLAQPLVRGQRIYPLSGEVAGVAVTVFAYLQYLPLALK